MTHTTINSDTNPNDELIRTDPHFVDRLLHFADEEVAQDPDTKLDAETRYLAILATLLGCQGTDEFHIQLTRALDAGLSPVEVKEVVYQAVDYLGLGRVRPFLGITNDVLEARGVQLPLPDQTTTTMDDRLETGNAKQVELFGAGMDKSYERSKINYWLADNCFGDYYTRTGLTNAQREMITFCYLSAQGGVEPQLTAHAKANIGLGNDAGFLRKVTLQCLPYIGYPRTLNTLRIVDEADKALHSA
ncbi:carboxymuconolactone decarboxylase family protein [Bifidobacterium sp. AGR2158]|uniref:carboxymuconolactone decarboxylase family protein n=1 Tax=Bifidobacterium sp. AGR2158 TaxID=1280675 RepID=UPI000423D8CF|nr:carboxymuconolactone decarboxylase family protein [Bifidobacterium sp. AGR2158]